MSTTRSNRFYKCYLGCKFRENVPLHKFPNPNRFLETFKAWVEIVGKNSADDIEFYRSKRICGIHFTDKDKNRNNRLNCLAVLSLYLPSNVNKVDSSTRTLEQSPLGQPTTSIQTFPTVNPGSFGKEAVTITGLWEHPTTNKNNYATDVPVASVFSEHNYHQREEKRVRKVPLNLDTRKKSAVLVCRNEQRQIRILRTKIQKLKKETLDFKARLSNADKLTKDRIFNRLTQIMTPAGKLFTRMQFDQTSKKPAGRRFSLEEKILSLSIFKKVGNFMVFWLNYLPYRRQKHLKCCWRK